MGTGGRPLQIVGGSVIIHPALVLALVIIGVVIIGVVAFQFNKYQQRQAVEFFVLNFMAEKRREFCRIDVLEFHSAFDNATVQMTCNARPFFAEYYNQSVHYELNGWSWLKNTEYWDELQSCDFFKKENGRLLFLCFKNATTQDLYSFSAQETELFEPQKTDFLDYALASFARAYPYLESCSLLRYEYGNMSRNEAAQFVFSCDERNYTLKTSYYWMYPPGLYDTLDSGEKAFHCDTFLNGSLVQSVERGINRTACMVQTPAGDVLYDYNVAWFPVTLLPSVDGFNATALISSLGPNMLLGFNRSSLFTLQATFAPRYYYLASPRDSVVYFNWEYLNQALLKWEGDGFYEVFFMV
ncbi:hypothetical protein COT72_04225 [archaeon CG10_big_fil_rev_8_21_14_0_10_43_11]|nr:MAG: hypothetical protein COT72_04225 [archaeon CG10_big_fil_rev_8_21_14_0_10_43_11]